MAWTQPRHQTAGCCLPIDRQTPYNVDIYNEMSYIGALKPQQWRHKAMEATNIPLNLLQRLMRETSPGHGAKIAREAKKLDSSSYAAWIVMNYPTLDPELIEELSQYATGASVSIKWVEQVDQYADTRYLRYGLWLLGASQEMIGVVTGATGASVGVSIRKCCPDTAARQQMRQRVLTKVFGLSPAIGKDFRATVTPNQISEYIAGFKEYHAKGGHLPSDPYALVQLLVQLRNTTQRESDTSEESATYGLPDVTRRLVGESSEHISNKLDSDESAMTVEQRDELKRKIVSARSAQKTLSTVSAPERGQSSGIALPSIAELERIQSENEANAEAARIEREKQELAREKARKTGEATIAPVTEQDREEAAARIARENERVLKAMDERFGRKH